MDKLLKRLLIVLVVMIILVPIGLLATYGGEAYGEWGPDELQKMVGYVPAGFQSITGLYPSAPLSGYGTPATPPGFAGDSLGYYLSAVVGVAIIGGAAFLIGKAVTKDAAKKNEYQK